MAFEKNAEIAELSKNHTVKIDDLKKDRDQHVRDIQLEFSESISELKVKVDDEKAEMEKKYSHKLSAFLKSNLKQPTMYDSICSYILVFKSVIFQEQTIPDNHVLYYPPDEPEIIIFQDITDLQHVEPYLYESRQQTNHTKKIITHLEKRIENIAPENSDIIKKTYAPPSYETIPHTSFDPTD